MNLVILNGRITKTLQTEDVREVKLKTGETIPCIQFTLAIKKSKTDTIFVRCVAFRETVNYLINYTKKGYIVGIQGKLDIKDTKATVIVDTINQITPTLEKSEN